MRCALILHHSEFSETIRQRGLEGLAHYLIGLKEKALSVVNTNVLNNGKIMYENGTGYFYSIAAHPQHGIQVWDQTGTITIGQYLDNWHEIEYDTRLFEMGIIRCASCNEKIKLIEAKQVFAGRYCPGCYDILPDYKKKMN